MPRDTIVFDINETILDLTSLKSKFKAAFGDEAVGYRQDKTHNR
jgi:2-haloacid dehalogenase